MIWSGLRSARHIAAHPDLHSREDREWACMVLEQDGDAVDRALVPWLRGHIADQRGPGAPAVFIAIGFCILVVLIITLAALINAWTDWDAVLRFIAPTAFETRSIEEVLESAAGRLNG